MKLRRVSVDEQSERFDFQFEPGSVYVLRQFSRKWRRFWINVLLGAQPLANGEVEWPASAYVFEAPLATWQLQRNLSGMKAVSLTYETMESVRESMWHVYPEIREPLLEYEQLVSRPVMHDSDSLRVYELETLLVDRKGYEKEQEIRSLFKLLNIPQSLEMMMVAQLNSQDQARIALARLLGLTRRSNDQEQLLVLLEPEKIVDQRTIRGIGKFLKSYAGKVIISSESTEWLSDNQLNWLWLDCMDGRLTIGSASL